MEEVNTDPKTLSDLPDETIEHIAAYLDFDDLKFLSETCHRLNEISWKFLGKVSKLSFFTVLNNFELKVLRNSTRKYENIELNFIFQFMDSIFFTNLRVFINQMHSMPTISIKHLMVRISVSEALTFEKLAGVFEQCNLKYEQLSMSLVFNDPMSNVIFAIQKALEIFPNVSLKLLVPFNNNFLIDKKNRIFKPIEIIVRDLKIRFKQEIENTNNNILYADMSDDWLKKLLAKALQDGAKNVEVMNKLSIKLFLRPTIIPKVFDIHKYTTEPWNTQSPCQLKRFACTLENAQASSNILKTQKFLRYVFLHTHIISKELLQSLANNNLLTTLALEQCDFEESLDLESFEFLRNIPEIRFVSSTDDFKIIEAIISNSGKVNRLYLSVQNFRTKKKPNAIVELGSLRVLKLEGEELSKYISERVVVRNVEIASVDCSPRFLFGCKKLINLYIGTRQTFQEVKEILRSIPSLEILHVNIKSQHVSETFKYIVKNSNNIVQFLISTNNFNIDGIVESILKDSNIKYTKYRNLYQTEKFSFETLVQSC